MFICGWGIFSLIHLSMARWENRGRKINQVVRNSLFLQNSRNVARMKGEKKTCPSSNEGSRREDIALMTPWWPWEYVQLPRPPSMDKCRLWLIVSWYPPPKWLSHLDQTVTVVVLQMLRYVRNIILITKQQLVVCVSHLPWAGSAKGIYLFICLLQHQDSKR